MHALPLPELPDEQAIRAILARASAATASADQAALPLHLDLAPYIDHTILKPEATQADIDRLCAEAHEHHFAAVCVNPLWVRRAARQLDGTRVAVASVVGFPLGASVTKVKVSEARQAMRDGATELDMVLCIGALKSGDLALVHRDIAHLAEACHAEGARLKVILETALLTDEEKVLAAALSASAGADYVKTSTGFGPGGATVHDVAVLRQTVGNRLGVKASGGIRTAEEARRMIAAGATRIGTSSGVAMVSSG